MSIVRSIVERHAVRPALAGAAPAPAGGPESSTFDREALRAELERCRRSREVAFWICLALVAAAFVLSASAAVVYREDPGRLKALYAVTGAGVMSLIGLMISLWQQKVKADLVAALASGLTEDSLKGALGVLVAKL